MSPATSTTVADSETVPLNPPESIKSPLEMDLENSRDPEDAAAPVSSTTNTADNKAPSSRDTWKLIFGAGGIYAAFLYYGSLQEDVFSYKSPVDGAEFGSAWFLQCLEAMANVAVGFVGRKITGGTPNLPLQAFWVTGATQVSSKACTALALANGLSFPVATLAKTGKMAPVMAGQLILGGASYSVREYLQVVAIIGGTAILSLGKKKGGESHSTPLGLMFILLSLLCDGLTGGLQKRLKSDLKKAGLTAKPYDFMFYTNLSMMGVAFVVSILFGDFAAGYKFCAANPSIWKLIIPFSMCSAVGQSFIFYTIAHFDPLVCSTVTTTRKIFSVLLSILTKGHKLSLEGWGGVSLAICGILSEVHHKIRATRKLKSKVSM